MTITIINIITFYLDNAETINFLIHSFSLDTQMFELILVLIMMQRSPIESNTHSETTPYNQKQEEANLELKQANLELELVQLKLELIKRNN